MASQNKSKPIDLQDNSVPEVLCRTELIECWIRMHGRTPPKHLSAIFLRRALAYELQCKQLGGHSSSVRRALKAALKQDGSETASSSTAPNLSPGAQLVREWNGRSYRVEVAEDGFLFDGKSYRSLSAIAHKITGTNWSGPRFFGLARRSRSDSQR
ncbi:MAG: DUF2924 domain-containing protein [Pseudomonadota bacterium]